MTLATEKVPIYCDCCGREVMAFLYEGKRLVIVDRRHGRQHTAVLLLDKIQESVQD